MHLNKISESIDVAVIGGGAAGFFMAANLAELRPDLRIVIFEKTPKVLSKVLISGGGRCNVTNATFDNRRLADNYPRGGRQLRKVFGQFAVQDTINWFQQRGVDLKTEPDGRMFPVSNSSETIVNCLKQAVNKPNVNLLTRAAVTSLEPLEVGFKLQVNDKKITAKYVFLATGGYNKMDGYQWLANLGLQVEQPVPSLFTFNLPDESIKELPGLSVPLAEVRLAGTKLKYNGPVLITHWGLSGPAVLKLSAWGARWLSEQQYQYQVAVSWLNNTNQEQVKQLLVQLAKQTPKKKVWNTPVEPLPRRLWEYLCAASGISKDIDWQYLPGKALNRLVVTLCDQRLKGAGKTTYKEEFVTAGGIDLSEVDFATMQCRDVPGLYFGGEVLNMDGITGGFNFQAAWSTAYCAAVGMAAAK